MYRNAVWYKGIWLAPGSESLELYQSKDPKDRQKLDKHLKAQELAYNKLAGIEKTKEA